MMNRSTWAVAGVVVATIAAIAFSSSVCVLAQESPLAPPERKPSKNPLTPAPPAGVNKSGDQLVKVSAASSAQDLKPGETFFLAFTFEIEPHWHIYWKNPGTSGGPTEINIRAPAGFTVGETLFPRPTAFNEEEGATYGYENKTTIFVRMNAPHELPAGVVMLNANVNWLVCKDVCLMGRKSLSLSLNAKGGGGLDRPFQSPHSAGESASSRNPTFADPFVQKSWNRIPMSIDEAAESKVAFNGKTLTIDVPTTQGLREATFFPIDIPGVVYGKPTTTVKGERLEMAIPIELQPENAEGQAPVAAGLIALGTSADDPAYEFKYPLTTP